MDKQLLKTYLKKPESLDKSSLKELEDLIKEFPYFQTARVLHAKNLNNLNDHRFENTLRKTAVYAPDRGRLFQIIMKDVSEKDESDRTGSTQSKANIKTEKTQRKAPATDTEQKTPKAKSEPEQTNKAEPKDKKHTPPAAKPATEAKPSVKPSEENLNDVLQQRLDELKKKISPPQETPKETKQAETTELKAEDFFSALPSVSSREQKSRYSLTNLEHNNQRRESIQEKEQGKKMPRTQKQALLDKFIKSESELSGPRVSVNKDGHAKQKTVEQAFETPKELVSETLAEIYIKQGHYEKALSAYKKLSLKYPQKNIYFASQIEKIKQLIQSKD